MSPLSELEARMKKQQRASLGRRWPSWRDRHPLSSGRSIPCTSPPSPSGHGVCVDKYKTELCRRWLEMGQCSRGPACTFAHGRAELRRADAPVSKRRTIPCKNFWKHGYCHYGSRCAFIHRHPDPASTADPGCERHRESNTASTSDDELPVGWDMPDPVSAPELERQRMHPKYKTSKCRADFDPDDVCVYGSACRYIHRGDDLQAIEQWKEKRTLAHGIMEERSKSPTVSDKPKGDAAAMIQITIQNKTESDDDGLMAMMDALSKRCVPERGHFAADRNNWERSRACSDRPRLAAFRAIYPGSFGRGV
jgi:hypothetical protein